MILMPLRNSTLRGGIPLNHCVRSLSVAVCTLGLLGGTAASAAAQDVTFNFTGVITATESSPFEGIAVGTPFTGSYTFSLATPNEGSMASVGDYWHRSSPYGVIVRIGDRV